MLTRDQIAFYEEKGYLHLPQVYTPQEVAALTVDLEWAMDTWATTNEGWTGPWRDAYMDEETNKASKLTHLHDLQFFSEAWRKAVEKQELVDGLKQLLGPNVELHHTTLHAKPPSTGHPFPMHQDSPFYQHTDGRFIDALVHIDDTFHENGEIRFMAGSHKQGHIEHVLKNPDGSACTPHLPTDEYALEDTEPVPAQAGDVVLFNIYTIHGSYINQTDKVRRMVRVGYRDPANKQLAGQSVGRPGLMLAGRRDPIGEAVNVDAV